MTFLELPSRGTASAIRFTLPVFAAAIFLSAFLLFAVQPMFAKMALPSLGGSPSVWSVAMVFFQTMLLAGYCYAHLLNRHLAPGRASLVHLAVMMIAFLALPIGLGEAARHPPTSGEATWLIGVFLAGVGLPFFAIAGNGPLLQAWFARSGHRHAADPYFLYGASNVGSFAALIAYPLLFEPLMTLRHQALAWTIGFGVLAALIALAALAALRGEAEVVDAPAAAPEAAPGMRRRLAWLTLAAVPSGLLVSVTAHVSTDVAAAPLLWVAPLALFLGTFPLAFRDRPAISDATLGLLQIGGAGLVLMLIGLANQSMALGLPAHLGLFFVNAMVCHVALYRLRPATSHLTDFYLMMSLGGVIGGVLCGLVAPRLFSSVLEYPLLIAAALVCSPAALAAFRNEAGLRRDAIRFTSFAIAALTLVYAMTRIADAQDAGRMVSAAGAGVALMLCRRQPGRAAIVGVLAALTATLFQNLIIPRETHRSFFGVHKIREAGDGQFRILEHGTTLHGAMRIRDAEGRPFSGRPEPTTYYSDAGPLAEAIRSLRAELGGTIRRASLVGLGAGSLACQFQADEDITFFEIDPEVIRIASDPAKFRFLSACAPEARIVPGDARLTLAREREPANLIVVDAFSSDAIPLHLLTREAIGEYVGKLAPDGVLLFHISNKYFELSRILARTAAEAGLVAYVRLDISDEPPERRMRTSSEVMALARAPAHLGALAENPARWRRVAPDPKVTPWTDDYSNILRAMMDKAGW